MRILYFNWWKYSFISRLFRSWLCNDKFSLCNSLHHAGIAKNLFSKLHDFFTQILAWCHKRWLWKFRSGYLCHMAWGHQKDRFYFALFRIIIMSVMSFIISIEWVSFWQNFLFLIKFLWVTFHIEAPWFCGILFVQITFKVRKIDCWLNFPFITAFWYFLSSSFWF